MRKGILLIFTMLATLVGCGQYDDSELKSDINDLKSRMAALEKQCKNMNENLTSLQAIVDAIRKQDGIVSVTDLPDGQGYSVKFVSGKVIYLYNGKNGTDGVTPKISVRKDSDGIYYWTVDGDWLIVDGKKVRAVGLDGKDGKDGEDGKDGQNGNDGKDAITPQLKIVEGFWYISYDNGKSWNKLGKATGENGKDGLDGKDGENGKDGDNGKYGDNFFKSVNVENGYAIFVLNDSSYTTLKIPMSGSLSMACIKYVPENLDGVAIVPYLCTNNILYVAGDFTMKFEVHPQRVLDYIWEHNMGCLSMKVLFVPSMSNLAYLVKNVYVSGNTLNITMNGESFTQEFFNSVKKAYFRLGIVIDNEEVGSEYVPLLPGISGNAIIEYTTEDEKETHGFSMYYSSPWNNSYVDGKGQIKFNCIDGKRLGCRFNNDWRLRTVKFVTPIKLESLDFNNCPGLTSIDISYVNTEQMIGMDMMFKGCKALVDLNLSNITTTNVNRMTEMFYDCSSLTAVNLSRFDTKSVTSMDRMFSGCSSLAVLNLSGFDTRAVYGMDHMFSGCSHLTDLDLSSFNTWNVSNMYGMFKDCSELKSLNLSSFETWQVYDMREMFSGCKSLTNLDLSYFDTQNVSWMSSMFNGCSRLTSLDLSSFDTNIVGRMDEMFKDCSGLVSLNLSNFSIQENCSTYRMFDGCTNLKEIIMRGCNKRTIEKISKVKPEGAVIITD